MADGLPPGAIRTFLIADIRGYTAFTQAQGDEAAARLAARFAEIIREAVEEQSGQLLELRGDEALCVFDSPRGALRSGVAAQRRFADEMRADPSMPLRVGMGIDAGEAVPVEGGYRGGALNLAARLCGQARPGEVLVSEGVVHLARRVGGIEYAERGRLELKGLPEVVRAFEARFELQLPETRAPPAPRKRRLAAAVAIPIVLAIVSALVILNRPESKLRLSGGDIGVIDPGSGRLRIRTPIGGTPGGLVAAAGSIWVTDPVEDVMRRIDPETGAVSDTVGRVGSGPTSLAFGDSSVWVVDEDGRAVRRIDPDRGEVVGPPIEVGNGPSAIAFGEGGAWVVNALEGTVSRIDPERSREIDVIAVGADPAGIAVGAGAVWVAVRSSRSVLRIDPGTNSVVERFGVGNEPAGVAVEGGLVWVANATDGTITRVDAATGRVRTIVLGGAPGAVRATPSAIWAALPEDGAAARVDAVSGNVTTVETGGAPIALDVSDGELWVASAAPPGSHIGGTLRLVQALDVPSLDPAAFIGAAWPALTITNDGLLAYRRTGGPAGAELVADLATTIPEPSDGGRTWTFTLRHGIRYADGRAVLASHVLFGLERSLALRGQDEIYYSGFATIVGASACLQHPGEPCDLSEGIEVDDPAGRITFHLLRREPGFLNLLALPLAYAVPNDVPARVLDLGETIPATGPYVVATYEPGTLRLVRNPQFRVWSTDAKPDGYPDEIVWTTVSDEDRRVGLVEAGEADGFSLWRFEDPAVRLTPRTLDQLAF
jgi:class 3 adenylate cyclase